MCVLVFYESGGSQETGAQAVGGEGSMKKHGAYKTILVDILSATSGDKHKDI